MLWRGIHRSHSWHIRQDGPLSKCKILIPIGSFSFRSQAMLKLGHCRSEIRTLGVVGSFGLPQFNAALRTTPAMAASVIDSALGNW